MVNHAIEKYIKCYSLKNRICECSRCPAKLDVTNVFNHFTAVHSLAIPSLKYLSKSRITKKLIIHLASRENTSFHLCPVFKCKRVYKQRSQLLAHYVKHL